MTLESNLCRRVIASPCLIEFWLFQIAEHALFLCELIDCELAPKMHHEAQIYYKKYYNLCELNPKIHDPMLCASFFAFLFTLCKLLDRKIKLSSILSCEVFSTFVKHLIYEQAFFVRLCEGKITVKLEIMFWLTEIKQHTELSLLFLSDKLSNSNLTFGYDICDNIDHHIGLSVSDESLLFDEIINLCLESNKLLESIDSSSVFSSIINHELREGKKGVERIKLLLLQ